MRRARPRDRHRAAIVAMTLLLVALPAHAVSAPSPEEVRSCVERNLPRYSEPADAVTAQYADVETLCRAGLEDGTVSIEFEPGSSEGGGSTTTPDPKAGAEARTDSGANSSNGNSGDESLGGGATGSAGTAAGSGATPPANGRDTSEPAATSSEALVAMAIAQADSGAGSPLPSSLSDGPVWLLVLIGGAAALIVGAAAKAVRRRLN